MINKFWKKLHREFNGAASDFQNFDNIIVYINNPTFKL